MNQENQNNNPDGSGDAPRKRKRGRPRKYPKVEGEEDAYTSIHRNINRNRVSGENVQPPRFERVNGNQPRQSEVENNSDDAMVGQVVSGVIEGAFDAGYLLSVKIGNSDTILSGLAFKPGRYVPISAENDVAPGVPMIRRNVVPFPSGTNIQAQNPQPKERSEQHVNVSRNENRTVNGSPSVSQVPRAAVSSSNLATSEGKNVSSVAELTSHPLTRGNVVPIVLPPNNSSNLVPVNNQQPQVLTQASLGNVSDVTKEVPAGGNQAPSSQARPLSRGSVAPIVLPSNNSSNVLPVNNQPPQVMTTQAPLGSVSGVIKEIPAPENQMPSSQTHPLTRGKVVPIQLSSGISSNLVPANNQPHVLTQAPLGNVCSVTKQIPADGNKVPSFKTQTSQNTSPRGVQNEHSRHDQSSANAMNEAEAMSMRLPDMPFEKLVTEVVKRIQVPSDSIDTETDNSKSSGNLPVKDSSSRPEDQVNKIDQPISIEPVQDVQAGPKEHSASTTTKHLEIHNTGKMTELLQALQDNTMLNQEHEADGETGQSTKRAGLNA